MNESLCTVCGNSRTKEGSWYLRDYYGLSGTFCSKCYEKVSHDPYGSPVHPIQYRRILEKLSPKNSS